MRHNSFATLAVAFGSVCLASLAATSPAARDDQAAPPGPHTSSGQTGTAAPPVDPSAALPLVNVDRDDVVIRESCRVSFGGRPIRDENGNGVLQIVGSNITVDCLTTTLYGADPAAALDTLSGTGIVVTGTNVVLKNAVVRGFRCGVLATGSTGSTFERLTLSDNVATRLLSTPRGEDGADWLWPHENDSREWVTRYGAGLCIERSNGVTVRDVTVRRTQNGIILDRVNESRIYDCDASFLSGWGLAMWRSSGNVVCRNAFDFCIRGYAHGSYNRGQDSAGILLFEQCSKNTIALNSITHGGDGIFGFAGKEALGERTTPETAAPDFCKQRGCNDNIIVGNDLSFAAAHGLELTFSFGNVIAQNTFDGNGICGIWGGYSQSSLITQNVFTANGGGAGDAPGKGLGEGGAIDIEHSTANRIDSNIFRKEGVAIELWWDEDKALLSGPWAKANGAESRDNIVIRNTFEECGTALALRETKGTHFAENLGEAKVVHDDVSELAPSDALPEAAVVPTVAELAAKLPGIATPIGVHRKLGGREAIRMTAWGPWDGKTPLLVLESADPDLHNWRLFGAEKFKGSEVAGGGSLRVHTNLSTSTFGINMDLPGNVAPYLFRVRFDKTVLFGEGCVYRADWAVSFFPSTVDPRTDLATWREAATSENSITVEAPSVNFKFGHDGPTSLKLDKTSNETLAEAAKSGTIGSDHFGTIAKAKLEFPPGTFTLRTISDDGIRVMVDGKTVIEDWTWHAPRESTGTITFAERTQVEIVVEHFELDGFAQLQLFIEGTIESKRRAPFGAAAQEQESRPDKATK
ncbi:MAG: right-handed parallel beta-helix repeat-containing protein [Phycisphaerae bacterium]|jgi:parallel beta-helix repeat protein|nr:right-handed parallel beta-helix repeat-containing protein [Phycisphaerae bacterium]